MDSNVYRNLYPKILLTLRSKSQTGLEEGVLARNDPQEYRKAAFPYRARRIPGFFVNDKMNIRERLLLSSALGGLLFFFGFFVNNKILSTNQFMSHIYDKHKDEDGFLYIYACAENTFG